MKTPRHPPRYHAKAVIFDLDGTLVDTAPDLAGALNHCLVSDGHQPFSVDEVRRLIGHGADALLRAAYQAKEGAAPNAARLQAILKRYLGYYRAHIADHSQVFDGVVDVLETLCADNIKLGLCTNKPHDMALALLRHLGWMRYFGSVIGGDALAVKKPDAKHVLAVARALETPAEDCFYVGDSEVDYAAATAAEIPAVIVTFGYRNTAISDMPGAITLDHYDALLQILRR
ncbi:MAG: phosphoglycolate phosphatase [Pseudomonadota bacterium]